MSYIAVGRQGEGHNLRIEKTSDIQSQGKDLVQEREGWPIEQGVKRSRRKWGGGEGWLCKKDGCLHL